MYIIKILNLLKFPFTEQVSSIKESSSELFREYFELVKGEGESKWQIS